MDLRLLGNDLHMLCSNESDHLVHACPVHGQKVRGINRHGGVDVPLSTRQRGKFMDSIAKRNLALFGDVAGDVDRRAIDMHGTLNRSPNDDALHHAA